VNQATDNLRDSDTINPVPPNLSSEASGKESAAPNPAKEEKRAKYQSPSLRDLTFE
jgi:hypothetical protein